MADKLARTDEQWRESLTEEQYAVLRKEATERAFTGKYWDNHDEGTYRCAGCGTELFDSAAKYDSGCGWPSFHSPADETNVETKKDGALFMTRTEVHCSACEGHLGHIFDDGPAPTGLRYCINSASLDFQERPKD